MVRKLYEASTAGVKIEILIRGNCSLVPGVKGLSENIRCVGIIDRYLEHSRILIFANGGNPRYFLGSADWMPRNLNNRIEVMTPVFDADLKKDLLRTINYGLPILQMAVLSMEREIIVYNKVKFSALKNNFIKPI